MTRRRSIAGVALLSAAALAVPSSAFADAPEFTLDGQAAQDSAVTSAAICAATPDGEGTTACFSTEATYLRSQAATVRAGGTPAGWAAVPTDTDREALAAAYDAEAASAGGIGLAVASDCGYADTRIWTGANKGGTAGAQGATGSGVWLNYSSTYNNKVSSYNTTNRSWATRWHDLPDGGGAYYGPVSRCEYESNLAGRTMGDGGSANDRFSSFAGW